MRSLRTGGSKAKHANLRHPNKRLRLETLEPRCMLSAGGLHVTALAPAPRAMVQGVDTIHVEFDQSVDPVTINQASFRLYESRGDAIFGNDNDVQVWPRQITASGHEAIFTLGQPVQSESVYFVQLAGSSAATSNTDATELALEMSGALLAPQDLHDRLFNDLEAIRNQVPLMTGLAHREAWMVGELSLRITPEAYTQYLRGEYHGLDALNATYGLVTIKDLGFQSNVLHLVFSEPYNPEALAPIYRVAEGVTWAGPNGLGGDSGTISVDGQQYTFSHGWGDCLCGCIYEHFWTYAVVDGQVQFLGESGDPLPGPDDYTWDYSPPQTAVVADVEGDRLDGEFPADGVAADLPSGDGQPGGDFLAQFTVKPAAVPNASIGLYDPVTSTFHLRFENRSGEADLTFSFGPPGQGWLPITGDWNGDGLDTVGLYDPRTSTFCLTDFNRTGIAEIEFGYGEPGRGWLPVAGDWNGDGVDTIGLYDPIDSRFYLHNSLTAGWADLSYVQPREDQAAVPVAGDWDGDGVASTGLYSPTTAAWDLRNPFDPKAVDVVLGFGPPDANWLPVAGDWNANGTTTVGLYASDEAACHFCDSNLTGVADNVFFYGPAGNRWLPIAGRWRRLPA